MNNRAQLILTALVSYKCFGNKYMKLDTLSKLTGIHRRDISDIKHLLLEYGVMTSKSRNGGMFICDHVDQYEHYYNQIKSHRDSYQIELDRLDMLYNKLKKNWRN